MGYERVRERERELRENGLRESKREIERERERDLRENGLRESKRERERERAQRKWATRE